MQDYEHEAQQAERNKWEEQRNKINKSYDLLNRIENLEKLIAKLPQNNLGFYRAMITIFDAENGSISYKNDFDIEIAMPAVEKDLKRQLNELKIQLKEVMK